MGTELQLQNATSTWDLRRTDFGQDTHMIGSLVIVCNHSGH